MRRGNKMKNIAKFIILCTLIITILASLICCTSYNDHTYTITVTDKERASYTTGSGGNLSVENKYLIYSTTSDGETKVFENTDSLFRVKFDSSDVYAELEVGETYEVTVVGYRLGFANWYENIIDFKKVSE